MNKLSKYEKLVIEVYLLAKELAIEKNKVEVKNFFDSYSLESFDLKAICKLESNNGEKLN